jgi:diguanylate cyclase (GGDEF)-like protein
MRNRILIVDDSKISILSLVKYLRDDYHINVASNGKSALEMAKKSMPDLILLDVIMPDVDGYEVLRKLKSDPETYHIPVIYISSLDEKSDEEKGLLLGAADYITKPYSAQQVKSRVFNQIRQINQAHEIALLKNNDPLTGLANRAVFYEAAREAWEIAKNDKTPLTVMMVGLKNFIVQNDRFGYRKSDKILMKVADILFKLQPESALVARWSGTLFALLLRSDDRESFALANVIQEKMEKVLPDVQFGIGIHALIPTDDRTVDQVITHAEYMLRRERNSL